jgi:hypothetical protein
MCPACLLTAALWASSTAPACVIGYLAVKKYRKKQQLTKNNNVDP